MKKLIEACDNSPRKLIQMCNRMVHLHISRSREILLDNIDLLDALGEVLQQKEIESIRSSALIHDAQKEAEGVRSRGLYLDDGGHVWVDGTPIEPPLTHLEFLLLRNLYNKSPTIVPTLNLIETIWPGGSSGDEQNLRKLIGRLRTRLEPDLKGSNSRFIKNSKGRGYWLNLDS
jgi:DNA-binding response OmpR family regulator